MGVKNDRESVNECVINECRDKDTRIPCDQADGGTLYVGRMCHYIVWLYIVDYYFCICEAYEVHDIELWLE